MVTIKVGDKIRLFEITEKSTHIRELAPVGYQFIDDINNDTTLANLHSAKAGFWKFKDPFTYGVRLGGVKLIGVFTVKSLK